MFWTAIDQSVLINVDPVQVAPLLPLSHKDYTQVWTMFINGIQSVRFVPFERHQLDEPTFQSWCSLRYTNPVPFANALFTKALSPDNYWIMKWDEF